MDTAIQLPYEDDTFWDSKESIRTSARTIMDHFSIHTQHKSIGTIGWICMNNNKSFLFGKQLAHSVGYLQQKATESPGFECTFCRYTARWLNGWFNCCSESTAPVCSRHQHTILCNYRLLITKPKRKPWSMQASTSQETTGLFSGRVNSQWVAEWRGWLYVHSYPVHTCICIVKPVLVITYILSLQATWSRCSLLIL